jgi:hypothetical protein
MLIAIQSCTHDAILDGPTASVSQEVVNWKPEDGIRKFIPPQYLHQFSDKEIEYDESLLRGDERLELRGNPITIPAGSTDALAGAIAAAGYDDMIVLESGTHTQNGTLTIDKHVTIIGYGATLHFTGTAFNPTLKLSAGMHIKSTAAYSTIRGIKFTHGDNFPGFCIFNDGAEGIRILNNSIENWGIGVLSYRGRYCIFSQNHIAASTLWQTVPGFNTMGIAISDGDHNHIIGNVIKNALFGIFTGGSQGMDFRNYTYNCAFGQILCKLTPDVLTVNGTLISTQVSTSNWLVMANNTENNFQSGYLVVDGANKNHLDHNKAANNAFYDIEVAGATNGFGYPTPAAFNNSISAYTALRIKDCGINTKIRGGTVEPNDAAHPCR